MFGANIMPENDEWMTARQVATELNVAYNTVLRWIKRGDLVGERIGPRVYRIRRSSLNALAR